MSDLMHDAAWRLLEAFRRHCGLADYVDEDNRQEDIANMSDALCELAAAAPTFTSDADLIEMLALMLYCDTYTQYGTCTPDHWRATSETQRAFCRGQAQAILKFLQNRYSANRLALMLLSR